MSKNNNAKENSSAPQTDVNQSQRREFLASIASLTAGLTISGTAMAQDRRATARLSSDAGKRAVVRRTRISQLWNYSPAARRKLTPRASALTLNDLDALQRGNVTPGTRNVTWRDLTSLVQALGDQYGMSRHPFNPSGSLAQGGKPAAGACCCCCTCCCGDCTFSIDCDSDETLTSGDGN